MSKDPMNQHKKLAMGEKVGFKSGGPVIVAPAVGIKKPMSPLTKMRYANGVPGIRKGGRVGKKAK